MARKPPEPLAYSRLGQVGARTPLVVAVPHAGRHYPTAMLEATRLPRDALETIEDRHADLLVRGAVRAGAVAIVARWARAFVDLNREEREIDPSILADAPTPGELHWSAKVSGGLGVVPSRIAAGGAIWKRPLDPAEIARRIAQIHVPYHLAIAAALDAAQARHGVAILLDCHSMPPLGPSFAARLVVGDRHGASADSGYAAIVGEVVAARGYVVARNRPYAGGFTLDRHGAPQRGRHAIQIEIDRSLYLGPGLRSPAAGLAAVQSLVAEIARTLIAVPRTTALAAE